MQSQLSSYQKRFVLRSDPYNDPEGDRVEFRLTYDGLLLGSNSNSTRAGHKHDIRKAFHPQLKRLWEISPNLLEDREPLALNMFRISHSGGGPAPTRIDSLAARFTRNGYRFVPLVTEDFELICSLDILWLRPDKPGGLIVSGDIDNRLKTLFDALRIPRDGQELAGNLPAGDEDPFFCLLEDDRLITHISVGTDILLQPISGKQHLDNNDVRTIITVKLRPTRPTWASIEYI